MKATPETPLDDLRERSIVPPFDVVLHDGTWYVTAHAGRADDTPRTILRFVDEVQLTVADWTPPYDSPKPEPDPAYDPDPSS